MQSAMSPDWFLKICHEWNLDLTPRMEEQFLLYYKLLGEWNSFMNLTAITEKNEVYKKHFLDSLSLIHAAESIERKLGCDLKTDALTLIDVGTGAGFPSIPLKIVFPNLKITMLDALQKRVDFLNETVQVCGLHSVTVLHGRAEDFASMKEYREVFDLSVSRAVASLNVLSEYDLPFVRLGGLFVSYKSEKSNEELVSAERAIQTLGGSVYDRISFYIDEDMYRNLILIEKISNSPDKYPRRAGVPSKKPL